MQSKIKDKKGPKGLSIFHRLLISYLGVGIIVVVITGVEFYLHEQKTIKEELKSNFAYSLDSSMAYFDRTYTSRIKEDLNFIEKSSAFNSFLSSQKDEMLLNRSLAEQLFLHFTDRIHGIYLTTRFIDSKGIEKVITSGNKRLRDYVSLDNFPPTDIIHLKTNTLFKRLKFEKLGTILFEGPFEYGGKFTFLVGSAKNEPEVGGFAGVVIFHCDLTDYFNHLDGYVFHKERVARAVTLDDIPIFIPAQSNTLKEGFSSFYSVSQPVRISSNNQALFKVVFSVSVDIFRTELKSAFKNLILYILAIMFFVVILALVMSRQFSAPLVGLVTSANRLAKGDLSTRVNIKANGEVGLLVDSFNNMVEDLQKSTVSVEVLEKEQKRFQDVAASTGDWIWEVDAEGRYVYSSAVVEKILGYKPEEIIGKYYSSAVVEKILGYKPEEIIGKYFYDLFHPDDKEESKRRAFEVFAKKEVFINLPDKKIRKDGQVVILETSGVPLIDADGKLIGYRGVDRDVTERKKAEEQLRNTYDELKATQDQLIQAEKINAVGQLASGVAHEVKNPLAIIIQGVDFLERKFSPEQKDTLEVLNMIKDSVRRANNIVHELLDFSRATELSLKSQDINLILENSLILVKQRLKFEHIEIVQETKKDIPNVLVDSNRIEQVFVNLLLNAIQAIPEKGKITIRDYVIKLEKIKKGIGGRFDDVFSIGERVVVVEIEDTGIGISEENIKRIFDPFFTTKDPGKGTGLGLAVSRNIISMHRGLIEIISQVGKGTKVIITLKVS